MTVAPSLWYLLCKDIEKFHFLLALCSKFIKKSRYRKNLFFFLALKAVDWHTTFIERCRNQETNHLEDDPFFFFAVVFFCVFFFKWTKLFWATCPMIKEREKFREWSNCSKRPARWRIKREKSFASGLIVPGDLPDRMNKTRKGFREWSHCNGLPAQWEKYEDFSKVVTL